MASTEAVLSELSGTCCNVDPLEFEAVALWERYCVLTEDPSKGAIGVAAALDDGCFAIQGPPGSGKTRLAAQMIVALVEEGKKVGYYRKQSRSHSNLLKETVEQAERLGVAISASQKSDDGQEVDHYSVTQRDNDGMEADLETADVFAGTSWLFTRPAFEGHLDYLVVDEAGQLSLANVVAVGTCARNLVLVGDPNQLAQPSKGTHPPGVDISASRIYWESTKLCPMTWVCSCRPRTECIRIFASTSRIPSMKGA